MICIACLVTNNANLNKRMNSITEEKGGIDCTIVCRHISK